MIRSNRRLACWIVAAAALSAGGCVTKPLNSGASPPYGYVVVGPGAASQLSVDAADTVWERSTDRVSQPVRRVAGTLAEEEGRNPACNRFFASETAYLVLFSSFCGTDYGAEYGTRRLAVVGIDGSVLARISWRTDEIVVLHPYMRFASPPD